MSRIFYLSRRLCLALITAGLGFGTLSAFSQNVSKTGTTAADFLQIGVGPRAMAQGGAFVASADDASAMYWNAAGLASLSGSEILFTHSKWLADITFDYVGFGFDLGSAGVLGLSLTLLSVPDMEVRTEDRQFGTGETFDAADMAVGASYARQITDRFSVGITAKYINQRIWHSSASAFAMDLGTRFRTDFLGGLTIGATITNFGSDMKLSGRDVRTFVDPDLVSLGNNNRVPVNYELDSFSLPLNFQFGLTSHPLNTRMHQLTVSVDFLHPSANRESINVGMEYGFQSRLYLRGGYRALFLEDSEGGFSAGLGINQTLYSGGSVKLDYAYRAGGRLNGIHIVGLAFSF